MADDLAGIQRASSVCRTFYGQGDATGVVLPNCQLPECGRKYWPALVRYASAKHMPVAKSLARRDLLLWIGAGSYQPRLNAQSAATSTPLRPDAVVWNARVITMDPGQRAAEAFAIRDGRFIAVGSNAEIRRLGGGSAQMLDAKGCTIVPGFIDTHNHLGGRLYFTKFS